MKNSKLPGLKVMAETEQKEVERMTKKLMSD